MARKTETIICGLTADHKITKKAKTKFINGMKKNLPGIKVIYSDSEPYKIKGDK